jgi:hypothetical protein
MSLELECLIAAVALYVRIFDKLTRLLYNEIVFESKYNQSVERESTLI